MRERSLSSSSIKTYLQCLLKYYYQYEDKKPRPGKSDSLAFGVAVHEALEYLYAEVSKTGQAPDAALYNNVLEVFMSSAAKNGLSNLALYEEGRSMVMSRLDSVDPSEKTIGLELEFNLTTPNGTPFTGSIDRLVEIDHDTVVILDYKTSRVGMSQEEADVDIQLSMYDLAVSMMFPQYKTIVAALDYLRLNEVVTHRTPEQRQMFVSLLDAIYKEINAAGEADIKPTLNEFCPWCDFKSFCPEYAKVINDPNLVLPPLGELDNDKFVDAWETASAAKRIIDDRQRELKSEAYNRLRGSATVKGSGKELYTQQQQPRMNYDPRTLFKIVGQDEFIKMVSVNKKTVDSFLKNNPNHIDELEGTASFSFYSPTFKTRKTKS